MKRRTHLHVAVLFLCITLSACKPAAETKSSGIYIVPGKMQTAEETVQTSPMQLQSDTAVLSLEIAQATPPDPIIQEIPLDSTGDSTDRIIPPYVIQTPIEAEVPDSQITTDTDSAIAILSVSSPVTQGQTAKLTAKGQPNTVYSIAVFYSSGQSSAKGLEEKTSDSDGTVFWEWKVGSRTKTGTYRIVVSGSGKSTETTFTVSEKN